MFTTAFSATGFDEAIAAAQPQRLHEPVARYHELCGLWVANRQRVLAPKWRGALWKSVERKTEFESDDISAETVVAPTAPHAKRMEFGTGEHYDGPGTAEPARPTVTPSLNAWAEDHGFNSGAQVAAIIAYNGGILPRRYIRQTWDEFTRGPHDTQLRLLADGMARALGGGR